MLDKALTRAGRFDRIVNVDPPDISGRRELFAKYIEPLPLADLSVEAEEQEQSQASPLLLASTVTADAISGGSWWGIQSDRLRSAIMTPQSTQTTSTSNVPKTKDLLTASKNPTTEQSSVDIIGDEEGEKRLRYARTLSEMTPGFTGAQISNLCNEAALRAAALNADAITLNHFSDALDRLLGGLERSKFIPPEDLKRTAVHEAGHALCAWFSTHSQPPLKVSVVWRGDTLGFTQVKGFERTGKTRAILEDELTVLLAGRVAEELVFGDPSTGAHYIG